jgi:hypothetical protein
MRLCFNKESNYYHEELTHALAYIFIKAYRMPTYKNQNKNINIVFLNNRIWFNLKWCSILNTSVGVTQNFQ